MSENTPFVATSCFRQPQGLQARSWLRYYKSSLLSLVWCQYGIHFQTFALLLLICFEGDATCRKVRNRLAGDAYVPLGGFSISREGLVTSVELIVQFCPIESSCVNHGVGLVQVRFRFMWNWFKWSRIFGGAVSKRFL